MIGPKKLSAIRHELQAALRATGDDPILWLEQRMAAPERESGATPGESTVLQSLRRFLEPTAGGKKRKQPARAKK